MFSLIICSRNENISEELRKNIALSIGKYLYEIIVVDNSKNEYNIFQAYNVGVKKARYAYLCFMHEDILYLTDDWGKIIIEEFKNPEIGMLGVVGGQYVGKYQTYWFDSGFNIGQFYDNNKNSWKWPKSISGSDVVAIDGLWMCIRRELFMQNKLEWDTKNYKGFHFYDMDMSMQVLHSGYRIKIAEGLLIQHISFGKLGRTFWMSCIRFHRKWNYFLPQSALNFVLPPEYKEGLLRTIFGVFYGKIKAIANKWH